MKKPRDLAMAAAALAAVVVALAMGSTNWALGRISAPSEPMSGASRTCVPSPSRSISGISERSSCPRPYPTCRRAPARIGKDPVTNAPYEYHPNFSTAYELYATFATDSATDEDGFQPRSAFWNHTKGRHCCQPDAGQVVEY